MEFLAFTTDTISWGLLVSALRRIQADEWRAPSVGLNLETPPSIVLSCIAVEAFVNEVSSLTSSYLSAETRAASAGRPDAARKAQPVVPDVLARVASIKSDPCGSFYVRYKRLLGDLGLATPRFLPDLSSLGKVRDALVHFRECDVPIIEDQDGVIRDGQQLPPWVAALQSHHYQDLCVLGPDTGAAWTVRMATDAMAAWTIDLALDAITYVLDSHPEFATVFGLGKSELTTWWNTVVREDS